MARVSFGGSVVDGVEGEGTVARGVVVAWRAGGWRRAHAVRGRERRETRGVRDLGFWVKFDGVHVAHELNL
jgi:hypothetical protein